MKVGEIRRHQVGWKAQEKHPGWVRKALRLAVGERAQHSWGVWMTEPRECGAPWVGLRGAGADHLCRRDFHVIPMSVGKSLKDQRLEGVWLQTQISWRLVWRKGAGSTGERRLWLGWRCEAEGVEIGVRVWLDDDPVAWKWTVLETDDSGVIQVLDVPFGWIVAIYLVSYCFRLKPSWFTMWSCKSTFITVLCWCTAK